MATNVAMPENGRGRVTVLCCPPRGGLLYGHAGDRMLANHVLNTSCIPPEISIVIRTPTSVYSLLGVEKRYSRARRVFAHLHRRQRLRPRAGVLQSADVHPRHQCSLL